jgi:branched-chain amino acid transport system ATP-binding protein
MAAPVLEIKNISKSFFRSIENEKGKNDHEVTRVLHDLSLTVSHATITALIGDNATGKTTLFNIISGLLKPDSGEIIYHDYKKDKQLVLTNTTPWKVPSLGIGRMFQESHIFDNLTVLGNMYVSDLTLQGESVQQALFGRKNYRKREKHRAERAEYILNEWFGENTDIWRKRNEPAAVLSEGEKRILGLARLFMDDYRLLLLDEPTSGLNQVLFDKIIQMIRWLDEEKETTIFLISHEREFVRSVAEYCAFVKDGKVELEGEPQTVLESKAVKKVMAET